MKRIAGTALTLVFLAALAGASERVVDTVEGLDPVALTRGEELIGKEAFTVERGRFRYLFANADNKRLFEQDPQRYEIQAGGLCARMGRTTLGDPDLYTVYDGRIYVFGTLECREHFLASPASFVEPAPEQLTGTPEAAERGAAWIGRTVEAMGGAARLDGLESYRERVTQTIWWMEGTPKSHMTRTVVFPDKVRRDEERPDGTLTTVLVPNDSFRVDSRGARTYLPAQRESLEKLRKRSLLDLLRSRGEPTFRAVALGPGRVGERTVERVGIDWDGVVTILGIDPQSARIVSFSYTGRSSTGAWGEVVEVFDDFRTVGGLSLPFATRATWNGEEDLTRSSVTETLALDVEIEEGLFDRPKSPSGP